MKRIYKIFSFILFFALLISFSGVKLHFHFCSHSNSLLAEIIWIQSNVTEMSCYNSIKEESCCGSTENEEISKDKPCDNCIDIVKKVETNRDYLVSGFNLLDDITTIELLHNSRLYDIEYVICNFQHTYIVYHPPPKSKLTSSWLC